MNTVLVSGAGIAGLAIAAQLRRLGFAVTIVERAANFRLGGQPVDVRGPALDVAERLGILEAVQAARTHMQGMSVVDANGQELEKITAWTVSTGRLGTEDVELLRDELARLLRQSAEGVEYLYGDTITNLDENDDGVRVTFKNAAPQTFDFVVGADGLYSKVRALQFGRDEEFIQHLGTYLSVCTSPNFLSLDNWQLWHTGDDVGFIVFPVRDNTELRITLTFRSDPLNYDHRDIEQQKRLVADRLGKLGGDAPRMLEAMWRASDFYFVPMAQIHMDNWSKGRVVLLGDAGYCASPLSGQGTSLALVGSYVLAEEIKKAGDDYRSAFARYQERMRHYVHLNQKMVTNSPTNLPSLDDFDIARSAISLDASSEPTQSTM